MNIIVISDTHCTHEKLEQYLYDPEFTEGVDIIIHAGDASNTKNPAINNNELRDFLEWYQDLPFRHKIFVPGNHDTSIESGLVKPIDFPDIHFLINNSCILQNLKFWGSPYTPSFGSGWAYNKARNKIDVVWETIPSDTDILITHGPPKGILDLTHISASHYEAVGCKALTNRVMNLPHLKYHIFGHIHDEAHIINSGYRIINNKVFVNASICDLALNPVNEPIKLIL